MSNWVILGVLAFLIGAWMDWYTTTRGLKLGMTERNGILRWIFDKFPWSTEIELAVIKLALLVAFVWMGVPVWMYFVAGAFQAIAGLGNRFGWWGPFIRWLNRTWSELRD